MDRKRSKKAKSLGAAGRKPVNNQKALIKFPPERNFSPTQRLVRRFVQNGTINNQAFTLANGHDQFLVVTLPTGAAVSFVDSWRIRKIHIWALSQGQAATTVTLTPTGADNTSNNFNDKEVVYVVSSRSQADPAYMCIKPKLASPLGGWHFTNNINVGGSLFQMLIDVNGSSTNTGCTMDIEFDVVYNWVGSPLGYTVVTATTLPGIIGARNILSGFSVKGTNNLG